MYVAVIDYGAGNIGSVLNMFKKIGVKAKAAQTADIIENSARLLLPGVGAFDHCMEAFEASGLRSSVETAIHVHKKPLLGICVGQQMMLEGSDEGAVKGLGWIKGRVRKFSPDLGLKIPHMGWSDVTPKGDHPLFDGFNGDASFYFVHSYFPQPDHEVNILATAAYGKPFCCGIQAGNIAGVQFHPEKSHRYGMRLLNNFAKWNPVT